MKTSNGMKSLTTTTILFIVSLILIAITAGAYMFVFVTITDKNRSIAEFVAKNEELEGRESRLTFAKNSLKAERSNIDKLSSYFIKESEVVSFTKKIETLGPQSGAVLSFELLEPGVVEGGVPVLNFRLKAKGGFSEIMKLISLLENYPTKFEWRSVNFVRDDSESVFVAKQKPQWVLTVSLSASNFLKK